jgi:ketosteroid isomerase-like protein
MPPPDVEIVHELFDAWNDGDLDAVKARFAEDVRWQEVGGRLDRPQSLDRETLAEGFGSLFETWQTYRLEPEEVRVAGDRVLAIVREVARGRASGLEVEGRWGYVITVRDGLIARVEAHRDPAQALAQVGLGPEVD